MDDVDGSLEKVKEIPTKRFYWKNRPDGPINIGTSAQKMQELYPELVSGDDMLTVDYSKMAVISIAAIKKLTERLEYLENRVKELEEKN